jgi:uncharacterized damage-inducible protein DinB
MNSKTSPHPETLPPFYRGYVQLVGHMDMLEALALSGEQMFTLVKTIPEIKGTHRYAPDKWSIKELLSHVMDAERIFAYRALRFARHDATPLAGFEENEYATQANAHARSIVQLAMEVKNLRVTTMDLFSSFTAEMLQQTGTASNSVVSVLNIGYIIAGHETHHRNILHERYLAHD